MIRDHVHHAVRARDVAKLRALLAAGADPNVLDADGQPALRYVLSNGIGFELDDPAKAMIEALLAGGADPSLNGVAKALVADAWGMVTSGGEANDAHTLERMLKLKPS